MGRNYNVKPEWVNNFTKMQKHYKCDILLFTSINKKTSYIEFCGWIWKEELDTKAKLYPKGTIRPRGLNDKMPTLVDNYEIRNDELRNMISLKEI